MLIDWHSVNALAITAKMHSHSHSGSSAPGRNNNFVHALMFMYAHADTFDVQVVEVRFTTSSITVLCQFADGSQAMGCSVVITSEGGEKVREGVAMRTSSPMEEGQPSNEAMLSQTGLLPGVYTVMVHDVESNGDIDFSESAVAHRETVNTSKANVSPTVTPPGMYVCMYVL